MFGRAARLSFCVLPFSFCLTAMAAPARPADSLVDFIGVNVHSWYPGTMYDQNWQGAIDAIDYIGIRYVRDTPYRVDRLNALTAQTGAKIDAIIHYPPARANLDFAALPVQMNNAASLAGIAYLEGPNEYEWTYLDDPDWASTLRSWVTQMHSIARSTPALADTPIIAPTLWDPRPLLPVENLIDIGNYHSYPGVHVNSRRFNFDQIAARTLVGPDKPVFFTEFGYGTAINAPPFYRGFSEAADAKYMTRAIGETFLQGISRSFVYELLDSYPNPAKDFNEQNMGLVRSDFTYKPSAIAVKNLITLLEDPGRPFTPGALDYTVADSSGGYVRHFALQKQNGDYYILLWLEADSYDMEAKGDINVPPQPITLTLSTPIRQAQTYLSNRSTDPTQTFNPDPSSPFVTRLILAVPDELLVLRLRPELIVGDATFDRIVDHADFDTLLRNFGHEGDWAHGDFNSDHVIDFRDFQILERAYGQSVPLPPDIAAAARVPEPATLMILAIACLSLTARRRQRRRLPLMLLVLLPAFARAQDAAPNPRTLQSHTGSVMCLAFSPDGQTLASSSRDKTIKLWDPRTGELRQTLAPHAADVYCVAWSPKSDVFASCSADQTIRLWDAKTLQVLRALNGHTGIVRWVAFSPDAKTLASVGLDKTVRLWDVTTGELKRTMTGHAAGVKTIAWFPDGSTLVTGSIDKTVRLWNAVAGHQQAVLEGHTGPLETVAVSPDGRLVASSSNDATVRLWDAKTAKPLRVLKGHDGEVDSVTFSPDGQTLATGAKDKTIKLWSAKTGELHKTLTAHTGRIESLTFSPDGQTLASGGGGGDTSIKLWDLTKP
jgi:uncharacterized protein YjiK